LEFGDEEHSLAFILGGIFLCIGPSLHGHSDGVYERRGGHIHGDVMSSKVKIHLVASALTVLAWAVATTLTLWPGVGVLILALITGAGVLVCTYLLAIMCAEALLGERLSSTSENDD
jgi:hypothetical protein